MNYNSRRKKNSIFENEFLTKKARSGSLLFVLFFFFFLVGIIYIAKINKLATMGYDVKIKEKAIEKLEKENRDLRIRIAEAKSAHNLEKEKDKMNMRKPETVDYIEIDESVILADRTAE